jgi:hypothetical protein
MRQSDFFTCTFQRSLIRLRIAIKSISRQKIHRRSIHPKNLTSMVIVHDQVISIPRENLDIGGSQGLVQVMNGSTFGVTALNNQAGIALEVTNSTTASWVIYPIRQKITMPLGVA